MLLADQATEPRESMMKSWLFGQTDAPLDPGVSEAQDRLGIEPYSSGLYYFARSCDTPMTIGLQGEWGSGKTSLMKMVQSRLSSESAAEDAVITFWFETWQYGAVGGSDSLGMLLLRDLTNQLLQKLQDDPSVYKFREKMGSALRAALPAMAGMATSMVTRSDLAGDAASAAAGALAGSNSDSGRSDMRACFEELVEKALATRTGENPRLVVFIDDLDRVPPKLAVRLLEVLKNFMDVRRCVFIVACDYEVVREGVSELMGLGDERGGHRKREKVDAFFHKLFQVQFRMPIGVYKVDQLLREYLEYWLLRRNEVEPFGKAKRAKEWKPRVDNFLSIGSTAVNAKGVRAEGWFQLLLGLLHAAVGTNPRAFKRYLNLVELTSCVDFAFGEGESGAVQLAHWKLGDSTSDAKTLRWCMSLFPIVAMQQRWPEVSAALLVRAGVRSRPDSRYGDADMTDFERRLRTIVNRWPAGDRSDEEVENALQAELFVQQLREIPGLDFFADDSGPAAQDLRRFARIWFELLDCGAGRDDRLSDEELDRITAWSERLGQMGAASIRLTGLARLREQCMAVDSRAGDGFVALASHVLDWLATQRPSYVGGKASDDKVWIWVLSRGSAKTLMSFYPKGDELQIRVNATRNYSDSWALPGLEQPGNRLKEGLSSLPEACAGHVQERPSTFWLDFGKGHSAARNEFLRELFTSFLLEVEHVARDAHDALATTAPKTDNSHAEAP